MIALCRYLKHAEKMPRGYGVAYYRDFERVTVVYPVLINVVVRIFHHTYWWLVRGCFRTKWEEELRAAEQRGEAEVEIKVIEARLIPKIDRLVNKLGG